MLSLHIKTYQHICLELFLVCFYFQWYFWYCLCMFLSWFRQDDILLKIAKYYRALVLNWKQWFKVKKILMMHSLFAKTQLFTSQDVNWWTAVVQITCGVFISCLDSISDGTHSLQSIHWWASDVKYISSNVFPWRNKFIYILDNLRGCTFFSKNYYIFFLEILQKGIF